MDIGTKELRSRLSEILDRVARGERVVVHRRGKPSAVISPATESPKHLPRRASERARIKVNGLPMSEEVIRARDQERF